MTLVTWSVAELALAAPAALAGVEAAFGELDRAGDINDSRLVMWQPTEGELRHMECAVARRSVKSLRRAVLKSLAESPTCGLAANEPPARPASPAVDDLAAALAYLRKAHSGCDPTLLVSPLYKQAQAIVGHSFDERINLPLARWP